VLESDLVDLSSHIHGPWPAALRDHQRLDDHFCAAWLLCWMGRARQAVAEADVAIAQARRGADYSAVALGHVFLGTALGLEGDYAMGFRLLDHAPAAVAAYSQQIRLWQTGFRVLLARELGLWPLVEVDTRQHLELIQRMGGAAGPFMGIIEAARLTAAAVLGGDPWSAMEQLRERAERLVHPDFSVDRLAARLAEADLAICVGDPVRAMQSAAALAEVALGLGARRELAHAARIRALAAHRLGDGEVAGAALGEATALMEEVGEPSLRWRVLAAVAEVQPGPASDRAAATTWEAIRAQLPEPLASMFETANATLLAARTLA
jgi:hypothetical protein